MNKKLILFLLLGMFLISFASAMDWDNVLVNYQDNNKQVEVVNGLNLPLINNPIASLKITSHSDLDKPIYVGTGWQKVIIQEIYGKEDYNNFIGNVEFKNMKNGDNENLEHYWEKAIYGDVEVNDYEEVCELIDDVNGTTYESCEQVLTGTHKENKIISWEKFEEYNIKKNEKITLALVVDVKRGDHYDGIPTFYGKEIKEWASWSAEQTTNAHGVSFATGYTHGTIGQLSGVQILTNQIQQITQLQYGGSHYDQNYAYIYSDSGDAPDTKLATSDVRSGKNQTFSGENLINLSVNTRYWILFTKTDGDYDYHKTDGASFNISDETFNWTAGWAVGSYDGDEISGIEMITVKTLEEGITLTITYPTATTYLTNTHDLNYTYSTDGTTDSCWYSLDLGVTNSSRENCGTNWSSLSADEGSNTWTVYGNLTDGTLGNSSVTFTIDTTDPFVDVTYPTGTLDYHELGQNLSLNWTATDTNLQTCWYTLDSGATNTSITCGNNYTEFNVTSSSIDDVIFYANDSSGNWNSSTSTWDYRLFLMKQSYETSIFESVTGKFSANFMTNGSAITSAKINYNNTDYTGTVDSHGGNNFTVSRSIMSPPVSANTNISFYWNISQNSLNYALEPLNQSVLNFNIDDCSVNSDVLYNFTIYDEEHKTEINGSLQSSLAKVDVQIYAFNTASLIESFNQSFNKTNPFAICLNSNLSNGGEIYHDLQLQYGATGYSTELYHIQNTTINSSSFPTNINLYSLNSSDTQVFKIIFRDSAFLPVENALIKIYRKYIDEASFDIVEIPKTDKRGETVGNFVLNDVIYRLIVVKYGETLETFDNVIAVCQTPLVTQCEIDLNAFAETIEVPDFEVTQDFEFTLGYNSSTNTVSSVFNIPSGDITTVSLNITQTDALGTEVCTDYLSSSSGTLSCVVPNSFGNGTVTAKLYKGENLQGEGRLSVGNDPIDIYGVSLAMIAVFLMVTLVGVGLSDNPVYTVLFLMVGVVLLFAMNLVVNNGFIGATATILFLFIAIILIIIKGARRN